MSEQVADNGGLRNDSGKLRLDLIPPEWVWGLASIITAGTEAGYPERNWERGMKWSKMVGCTLRHLFKFVCGEKYDIGPGGTRCHHLLAAAWNILALFSYDVRGIGENDLVGSMDWLKACRLPLEPEYGSMVLPSPIPDCLSQSMKKQAFREAGWHVDSDYDHTSPAMYGTWDDKGGI